MGYVFERPASKDGGATRYTAVFRDVRGRLRSAGTHPSHRLADRAWRQAEAEVAAGKVTDPQRGRQTLRHFVENGWFANHVIEATTRQNYRYMLDRYLLPELGAMRMVEILPNHIREWITRLQHVHGANPPTVRQCKTVLDAILTTAVQDQVIMLHAGRGVKTPPVAAKPRRIINAEQFRRIHAALPHGTMRLLVETDVESGLRWGELTELRVKDLDLPTGVLTVSRAVVRLTSRRIEGGPRFLVKAYPKDKEWRRLRLADHLLAQLAAHIAAHQLGPDDLLFRMPASEGATRRTLPEVLPDPALLGLTEPNADGRQYPHGTTSAYGAGRCRCRHCRDAVAAYRAARRANGKDHPRQPRHVDTDGHISNHWFRAAVWLPAIAAADLGFHVTPHGLRHAHASWLLAGGADLQVVKERLGHASITTTEKYLHTLPGADKAALAALDVIRGKGFTTPTTTSAEPDPSSRSDDRTDATELAELRQTVARMKEMFASLG